MYGDLLAAIEHSNLVEARTSLKLILDDDQTDPRSVRQALFPAVHRVINPPFINPHLSKMYAINREFLPYLQAKDIASLLRIEVEEYTRREKLPALARPASNPSTASFAKIERSIAENDVTDTAIGMAAFLGAAGPAQLTKKLLLLGSGFFNHSLGHSVSCTAFILQEMIIRTDEDPWPVLVLLADYFCKGGFQQTPELQFAGLGAYREVYLEELRKAVSGSGIVALHHTITLYAIERSRHHFEPQEYDHMLTMWQHMMDSKGKKLHPVEASTAVALPDYPGFYSVFSQYDPVEVLNMVKGALGEAAERRRLESYLIKAVLQCYNGQYNPHCLTGLGSALWIIDNFHDHPDIVMNALLQYLEFFFSDIS